MNGEEKIMCGMVGIPAGIGTIAGLAAYIRYPELQAIDSILQHYNFPAPLEYLGHGINAAYVSLVGAVVGAGAGVYPLVLSLGIAYLMDNKNNFTNIPKS